MKKFLATFAAAVVLLPSITLAAFNDVTLTTSTMLSVGGYTLNITGSSAAIQSIVVNASNFSVALSSGSSIQVTSPTYQQLSVDVGTFTSSNTCATNASVLTLSSSGASGTVTVTPQATVCSTVASASGGGNGPIVGSYGGGGSGSSPSANISSSVKATSTAPISTVAAHQVTYQFIKDLKLGKTDSSVQKLQQFLNAHGFTIAATGPGSHGKESTYFGNATRAALIKFQKTRSITPASGFFGPITRAAVNSIQ